MIMLLGFLLTAVLLGWAIYEWAHKDRERQAFGWVFGILIGVSMLSSCFVPLANAGRLQEMRAFYQVNADMYAVTITETKAILSEQRLLIAALIPVEGSIEKLGIGDNAAKRILEWRQAIVRYNIDLEKFRYFDANIWTGVYYPAVPDDLKLLHITSD